MIRSTRLFALLLCGVLLTGCAPESTVLPKNTEQVGDGVYLFRDGGQRSLFLITDAGVIVTDPLNADAAQRYKNAIESLTDLPVRFVVYSHYHWDRVSGAQVFADSGAKVIAQARCAERFRDNPNPDVVMPDITFDDRYEVSLGDRSLDLHYFGPSHGDCLTVFVAQPAGLIQIVDLVEPPAAAFPSNPNVPYVRPHNLRQFFIAVEALVTQAGITQVLASRVESSRDENGEESISPASAPVSIIGEQARFWNEIYAGVEFARAEGNIGIDSFVRLKTIDVAPFESFDRYRKEDLPVIMRRFAGFYDMGR